MTYLGIDYGEKRIGLAKANSEVAIATPLRTIVHSEDITDKIIQIVSEEGIDEIVLGIPVSFSGKENNFAKSIRDFGKKLEQVTAKSVHLENELLTTRQSQKDGVADKDSSSAALILQGFLDKQ